MSKSSRSWIAAAACGLLAGLAPAVASAAPSGALKHVETEAHTSLSNATGVTVSGDGRTVYGTGYAGDSIGVFRRNASTGALTFVAEEDGDGLGSPMRIVAAPDGDNAYVTGNVSNSVHSYSRAANGALSFLDSEVDGNGGVDGIDAAYGLVVAPGGKHVYAAGSDDNAVALFNRAGNGSLQWADAFIHGLEGIEDMQGPREIAISRDGRNVYVASATSGAVVTFKRFVGTGQLDFVDSDDIPSTTTAVETSPNGKRVYVGSNDGVRTYRRNATTGALTLIGLTEGPDPLSEPLSLVRGLAAAPANDSVYAPSGNTVAGLASLTTRATAQLKYLEFDANAGLNGTDDTAGSPDGRHVYAVGGPGNDGRIGAYSRQPDLELNGKRKQKAKRLTVRAECSAECRVTISGKGLKRTSKQLRAGRSSAVRVRFKGAAPSGGKVTLTGRAKAGNRVATDKFTAKLR